MAEPNLIAQTLLVTSRHFVSGCGWGVLGGAQRKGINIRRHVWRWFSDCRHFEDLLTTSAGLAVMQRETDSSSPTKTNVV
jgi:hypothetical protein